MKIKPVQLINRIVLSFAALAAMLAGTAAFAANQTWTNVPVNSFWNNTNNWIARGIPGATNSNTSADVATFNSPIALTGYGGVISPITNYANWGMRGLLFDTADCGAYVFGTGDPADLSYLILNSPNTAGVSSGGNVTVNSTVTNPIIFKEPIRMVVVNSSNLRYDITNNATSPNATLYFAAITNSTANTRPLNLVLSGSNTGTNTILRIDDQVAGSGAILLDKFGTGKWILSGPNDLPQKTSAGNIARVSVNEGTLVVKDVASLGAISAGNLFVTNTGVLQIDGITPQNLGMSIRNGGTIRMNGSGGINGLIVGNQAATTATLATTSASDAFSIGVAGVSVVSGGASDTLLNVNGPGTIELATANTYIGRWSFNSGSNRIAHPSGLGTGANMNIAAGAIVDSSAVGGFYTLTTAAISANGAGTGVGSTASTINAGTGGTFDVGSKGINLTFTPTGFSGDTTHPALYVAGGALSLNANQFTINNASGTALGAGTYRLIEQASGSVSVIGTPFAIVTGAGLAAGTIADVVVSGGLVNLVVSAHITANLSWRGGNPNSDWDSSTANWFDGASLVLFGNSDAVTFDSPGLANPTVNLTTTALPSSVKVDASTNVYTFSGVGQVAGPTSLTKIGTNVLVLATANGYLGGTTVSNGILRVGIDNAIPSAGSGNVSVYSPAVIDVNNFSDTINSLIGNGKVDNQGGGAATLSVGANNSSSTFTGLVQNTSGTLALRKLGTGTLTLPLANTHSGGTVIEGGTLRVDNYNSLAGGLVTNNAGTLNITTNVLISGLWGAGGTVANNSTALPVTITTTGVGEYTGVIANGAGGGGIRLVVQSGTTRLNGNCTYSNGTLVASGATLAVGVINPGGSGIPGTGGIIASNGATISLPTSLSTAQAVPNTITNIDAGGTVYFTSIGQANALNGQFYGGANNTNMFSGPMSIGGVTSFSNFFGTVIVSNGASVRLFVGTGTAGGDNTTFEVRSGLFSRDASTVRLGALTGTADGGIYNPSVAAPATFHIGAKGLNTTFPGAVRGSNNIVKVGAGSLTFNGVAYYTNVVTLPDTTVVNYTLFSNTVAYIGTTTVSNGTYKVVAPNNLTNSSSIVMAGGVLDATQIGYATNETTLDISAVEQATNTVVVTTATVQLPANQSLNGVGNIIGSVVADLGSSINPGLAVGTLTVSGGVVLNGTVNMDLNRSNLPQNSDRLVAASFTGSGATLNVTNVGPVLMSPATFTLFSGPVTAFTSVNLPATSADGLYTYTWQNDVAANGTITLLSGGVSTTPPTLTNGVSGTNLVLSWPLDHTGWTLQSQTNGLNVGISNNWFTVTNSTTTNMVFSPLVRTNPAVFYRLVLPLP